ncbi:MAG TPA: DUF937 domain-containing protein [Leptolyngbyaceae cyanobacterium]
MGLFDQVLNAINDPNRQASQDQVGQLINTVQSVSQQANTNPDTVNQAVSILGSFVRSSLQETRTTQGDDAARELVREGSHSGAGILPRLFNNNQQQQLTQTLSQRTGLNSSQIQMLLPILIPMVMRLLQSGESTQPGSGNNSVLSSFLDADRDGDVDMGDMLNTASRFIR